MVANPPDGAVEKKPTRSPQATADTEWQALQHATGVHLCVQCHKCTAGCPVAAERDLQTSQIVRLTQIGDRETLFQSSAIWRCTGCHTCTTRCPSGVNPAELHDRLKRRSLELGQAPADPRTFEAADALLHTVGRNGRLAELQMVRRFKGRSHTMFERFKLGMALFFRGKLKLSKNRMSDRASVKDLIDRERIELK